MTLDADDRLGTVTGPREITFRRTFPGPIEKVWAHLVDADKRRLWLASGEIEPRVGGKVALVFENATLTGPNEAVPERFAKHACVSELSGEVTEWAPPRRLAFTWGEAGSEVVFDLAEAAAGEVRLTLVHRNLPSRDGVLQVSGGWHAHLGVLEARLAGAAAPGFWGVIEAVGPAYDRAVPA